MVHLASLVCSLDVHHDEIEPCTSRSNSSQDDVVHAIDVLGLVLVLPIWFGSVLGGQQYLVDRSAMGHQ